MSVADAGHRPTHPSRRSTWSPTGSDRRPSVDDGLPFPTTTSVTGSTRFARNIPEIILREYWLVASSS